MAIVGFIKIGLLEYEACDFSADFIHDWSTHVFPQIKVYHAETISFLALLSQHATFTVPSTQEIRILTRNMLLLPFWGAVAPLHG